MFFNKSQEAQYLIVGLGNPEKKYDNTRHNIGFSMIDYLSDKNSITINKCKFNSLFGKGEICGSTVILLKPLTYMNLSGKAVIQAIKFFKIPPQNVIVLTDDISLDVGRVRLRLKGSAGGHNGLKSIIENIGEDFPRIKIGVGKKPHPQYDLSKWVLGKFTPSEKVLIEEKFDDINTGIGYIIKGNGLLATNVINAQKTSL